MRKIIVIGESVLDTVFLEDLPVKTFVGGRIANAAASLGLTGLPTYMVSECCTDHVGDLIVKFISSHNVDVKSIDRYTDGATAISLIFNSGGNCQRVNYIDYPSDRFDVIWPRIDKDDIVLFGSFYSIDTALRDRLAEMINYASERKAIIVYLPGFQHGINCRITKVMPAILENLEIADFVVAKQSDISDIFPGETTEKAFHNHIEYYCSNFLHINSDFSTSIFCNNKVQNFTPMKGNTENALGLQSGFVSGLIYSLVLHNITHDALSEIDEDIWKKMMDDVYSFATECAANKDNCISAPFAADRAKKLADALALFSQNML